LSYRDATRGRPLMGGMHDLLGQRGCPGQFGPPASGDHKRR
jgi:hypothetical protein